MQTAVIRFMDREDVARQRREVDSEMVELDSGDAALEQRVVAALVARVQQPGEAVAVGRTCPVQGGRRAHDPRQAGPLSRADSDRKAVRRHAGAADAYPVGGKIKRRCNAPNKLRPDESLPNKSRHSQKTKQQPHITTAAKYQFYQIAPSHFLSLLDILIFYARCRFVATWLMVRW